MILIIIIALLKNSIATNSYKCYKTQNLKTEHRKSSMKGMLSKEIDSSSYAKDLFIKSLQKAR